jgi:hypothetical protein
MCVKDLEPTHYQYSDRRRNDPMNDADGREVTVDSL